nr:ATP synthase F0 subunit 8 [Penenirmus auritus]
MPQMHPIYWLAMMWGIGSVMYVISASSYSGVVLSSEKRAGGFMPTTDTEFWVLILTM